MPLKGPNDLVFDRQGGFYFSDLGKVRAREMDRGAVYYAMADGSKITEVAFPMVTPNGVGLSPDEKTLYVAETEPARLWAFDIVAPGVLRKEPWPSPHGGRLVAGVGGYQRFNSLALDAEGRICVATLINGGITVISPDGRHIEHHPMPDPMTTNICFGGRGHAYRFHHAVLDWTASRGRLAGGRGCGSISKGETAGRRRGTRMRDPGTIAAAAVGALDGDAVRVEP